MRLNKRLVSLGATLACAAFPLSAYSTLANATDMKVTLSGDEEVPSLKSAGTGSGTISVGADNLVSGSVSTAGIAGTAAHIHEAGAGRNGPVLIPLTKSGDTYSVPPGTKLSAAQVESLKAGNLYINVHTAANPNGEIRAQLVP
jgi:hypothetical protein